MDMQRLYQLDCGVQHYAWGARAHAGVAPFIARLLNVQPTVDDQPYAELWIGAHPNLPSRVRLDDGRTIALGEFIATHRTAILGARLVTAGLRELPFLLKILDCERALSIQAHPDRALAARLHRAAPEHYPDANHKPEIAIALSPLTALCQFRDRADIQADARRLPPLGAFLECAAPEWAATDWLRRAYAAVFATPEAEMRALLEALRVTIEAAAPPSATAPEQRRADTWFPRLLRQYPADRGALAAFFLNIVALEPGQSVFLGAGEPHAYLEGTIIECMANSDNVVRAGLTPKHIDSAVLTRMLTYREGLPRIERGQETAPGERVYRPPVPEFEVSVWHGAGGMTARHDADGLPAVLLVLDGAAELRTPHGRGVSAARGSAWLWPAALASLEAECRASQTTIVCARPNAVLAGTKRSAGA